MEYNVDVKNRRLQVVNQAIGAGGLLKIGTEGMGKILSVVRLSTPAFTIPEGGVMDLAGAFNADLSAQGTGKARQAQITDSTGQVIIDKMTVGKSNAVIILTSDDIQAGQEVRVVSGSIAHA